MADFGLLPEGFVKKRLVDIKSEMEEDFRALFGEGSILTSETPEGKIIGSMAERFAAIWDLLQLLYDGFDPDQSSDTLLRLIVRLVGITANEPLQSTATLYAAGTPGETVPSGSLFAVEDSNDQFASLADVTLGPIGTVSVSGIVLAGSTATATATSHGLSVDDYVFIEGADQEEYNGLQKVTGTPTVNTFTYEVVGSPVSPATGTIVFKFGNPIAVASVDYGPIQALAGTLTVIVNSIFGLTRVENALDATLGRLGESDEELRERRDDSLQFAGSGTVGAIRAALLDEATILSSIVYENRSDVTDGEGRPPHSTESVVEGGTDTTVATIIANAGGGGIETFGGEGPFAIPIDEDGNTLDISFSRPDLLDVYVEFDLTTDSNYPSNGDALVKAAVLAYGNALGIGDDVIVYPALISSLANIPGITDVVTRIAAVPEGDPAPTPTLDANIVVSARERAIFDSTRIDITIL